MANWDWSESFCLGQAFLKVFIIKEPNKALYDVHGKVKLICTLHNGISKIDESDSSYLFYELEWYKLAPDGRQQKIVPKNKLERYKKILLDPLTEKTEGTYKCVVRRRSVNHYDFQLVNIRIRGKLI